MTEATADTFQWHPDEQTHLRIESMRKSLVTKYMSTVQYVLETISTEYFLPKAMREHFETAMRIFNAEVRNLDERRLSSLELNIIRLLPSDPCDVDQLLESLKKKPQSIIEGAGESVDLTIESDEDDTQQQPVKCVPIIQAKFDKRFKLNFRKRRQSTETKPVDPKKLARRLKRRQKNVNIKKWIINVPQASTQTLMCPADVLRPSQRTEESNILSTESIIGPTEVLEVPSQLPVTKNLDPWDEPTQTIETVNHKKRMIQRYNSLSTDTKSPIKSSLDENQNSHSDNSNVLKFKTFVVPNLELGLEPPPSKRRKASCGAIAKEQPSIASYKIKNITPKNPATYLKPATTERKIISFDDSFKKKLNLLTKKFDPVELAEKLGDCTKRLLKHRKLGGGNEHDVEVTLTNGNENDRADSIDAKSTPIPPQSPVKRRGGRRKILKISSDSSSQSSPISGMTRKRKIANLPRSTAATNGKTKKKNLTRIPRNVVVEIDNAAESAEGTSSSFESQSSVEPTQKRAVRTCTLKNRPPVAATVVVKKLNNEKKKKVANAIKAKKTEKTAAVPQKPIKPKKPTKAKKARKLASVKNRVKVTVKNELSVKCEKITTIKEESPISIEDPRKPDYDSNDVDIKDEHKNAIDQIEEEMAAIHDPSLKSPKRKQRKGSICVPSPLQVKSETPEPEPNLSAEPDEPSRDSLMLEVVKGEEMMVSDDGKREPVL